MREVVQVASEKVAILTTLRTVTPAEVTKQALEAFLPALQERYLQLSRLPRRDFAARIGSGDELLRALQQDGFVMHALDDAARRKIRDYVTPLAQEIMGRLDACSNQCPKLIPARRCMAASLKSMSRGR